MISPVHLVSGFSWSLDGSWQGNSICPRPFLEALLISRFCWEWEFFFHTGFTLLSRVRKDTPPPPFPHTFLVTWVFPLTRESASETRFWSHKSQNKDLRVLTKAFYLHSLSFLRILLSRPFKRGQDHSCNFSQQFCCALDWSMPWMLIGVDQMLFFPQRRGYIVSWHWASAGLGFCFSVVLGNQWAMLPVCPQDWSRACLCRIEWILLCPAEASGGKPKDAWDLVFPSQIC